MKTEHHLDLPRRLQIEFSAGDPAAHRRRGRRGHRRADVDDLQQRVPADRDAPWSRFALTGHRHPHHGEHLDEIGGGADRHGVPVTVERPRQRPDRRVRRRARVGIDVDVRVLDYAEHALSAGGDAQAAAYVECAVGDRVLWGVGHRRQHRHRLAAGGRLRGQPGAPLGRASAGSSPAGPSSPAGRSGSAVRSSSTTSRSRRTCRRR